MNDHCKICCSDTPCASDDLAPGLIFVLSPTVLLVQNAPMFYAGFGAREAVLLTAFHSSLQVDPNAVLGL